MTNALVFLQARMGSARLPGKSLLRICGHSILGRAIRRLQSAESIDGVVVLTTTLPEDDAIVSEAQNLGALTFRGPELDVLKRYQLASEQFRPEIIIRATADNPLVDIGSVDRIVRALRGSNLDYCIEGELPIGAATEAITESALRRSDQEAGSPSHREHVTLYVKENPELFRIACLTPPDVLRRPDLRLTVDTPEDFMFIEELIQGIAETTRPIPMEKYLPLAEAIARTRS